MTRKVHVLLPDAVVCRAVVDSAREAGIPDRHIHVIGSHYTPLEGLPEAGLADRSEFTRGLELGLGVGGVAGLLGGLLAVTFPPAGLVLGGGAVLASTLVGAGAGALVSGMVAKDIPNRRLAEYRNAIAAGQLLLIMEVPRQRAAEFEALVRRHYEEAEIETTAPTSPMPPEPATEESGGSP